MKKLSEMTLEELWELFPVVLSPYNPAWPEWYAEEEELIRDRLAPMAGRIMHIGSTSVPGLAAKPTVDILMEVALEADVDELKRRLMACGWIVMAEACRPEFRLDLCKGYTSEGFAERVFHLHVRYTGDWDEPYFCEYLRRHPEIAADYVKLKADLAIRFRNNRDAYTEAKSEFVVKYTAIARMEMNSAGISH